MNNNMVSKIRVGMSSTSINLGPTPIQNLKAVVKNAEFYAGTSGLILKRNHQRFLTLHSPLGLFTNK